MDNYQRKEKGLKEAGITVIRKEKNALEISKGGKLGKKITSGILTFILYFPGVFGAQTSNNFEKELRRKNRIEKIDRVANIINLIVNILGNQMEGRSMFFDFSDQQQEKEKRQKKERIVIIFDPKEMTRTMNDPSYIEEFFKRSPGPKVFYNEPVFGISIRGVPENLRGVAMSSVNTRLRGLLRDRLGVNYILYRQGRDLLRRRLDELRTQKTTKLANVYEIGVRLAIGREEELGALTEILGMVIPEIEKRAKVPPNIENIIREALRRALTVGILVIDITDKTTNEGLTLISFAVDRRFTVGTPESLFVYGLVKQLFDNLDEEVLKKVKLQDGGVTSRYDVPLIISSKS